MTAGPALTRRIAFLGGLTSLAAPWLQACEGSSRSDAPADRLSFRPGERVRTARRTGTFTVPGARGSETALVRVPDRTAADGRDGLILVLVLHGAGGGPAAALRLLEPYVESTGLVLVAPKSRAGTWDVLAGGYGPDVTTIDHLLDRISGTCPVDGYAIGGFSDGASYALSLGIANGDLFEAVVAFSPGFEAATSSHGRPRFFVSHGTRDPVLPIERSSRRIVPDLERRGYEVTYEEFTGGHQVPTEVRQQAVRWLVEDGRERRPIRPAPAG